MQEERKRDEKLAVKTRKASGGKSDFACDVGTKSCLLTPVTRNVWCFDLWMRLFWLQQRTCQLESVLRERSLSGGAERLDRRSDVVNEALGT